MPTYNHERFISKAIESVLMQKTVFPFELLINDDCSTDSTGKIASEYAAKYPEIIKYNRQLHNKGLLENYKFVLEHSKGKYVAILESDDCWTNPEKLQKQISFLDKHQEYGICAGDYTTIDANDNVIKEFHKTDDDGLYGDWYGKILYTNFICAATICFSKKYFEKYCNINNYIKNKFLTFDYPLLLDISANSKCHYIHENLSSYRVLPTSISNTTDYKKNMKFEESILQIQLYSISCWGTGSYTKESVLEKRVFECLNKALDNHNFADYMKYAKLLHSTTKKGRIIHRFPALFYFQHIIRIH
ncbi:MAG: glycosyltransferase [Treponema sp.]|nr:glycosyltransferase [Treponema sp.]